MGQPLNSRPPAGTEDVEDLEIQLLLEALDRRWGFDFREWARTSLTRRVRGLVAEARLDSVSSLQSLVLRDAAWRDRFLLALSIHSEDLFSDPGFWLAFRRKIVPLLRTYPQLRIWVTGCATGTTLWSLAILLAEEGLYERARIHATDMNDAVVLLAEKGELPDATRTDPARNLQLSGGGQLGDFVSRRKRRFIVDPALRRHVVFSRHNLATDASPNAFHVILSRNGMLYFGVELQERVQTLLLHSLVPFGILALGCRETLTARVAPYYEVVDADERIFRRRP